MRKTRLVDWFNSKYFPIYYSHRNIFEAKMFVDKIFKKLAASENQAAMDLCCGRGRYSIALNEKGLRVVGVDFSSAQIKDAKTFENENLKFVLSDVAKFTSVELFDYAFNFFSSFGYKNDKENIEILTVIKKYLKPSGKFVLDFWNPSNQKYFEMLDGSYKSKTKCVQGCYFQTSATIREGYYRKEIVVKDGTIIKHFREQVMVLNLEDFQRYFNINGFKIKNIFGNYKLEPYQELTSERMIFIVEKVYI